MNTQLHNSIDDLVRKLQSLLPRGDSVLQEFDLIIGEDMAEYMKMEENQSFPTSVKNVRLTVKINEKITNTNDMWILPGVQ